MASPISRSFVDPLSNAVTLSSFDVERQLVGPMIGRMPILSLGPFLHEATHFWCNNSPLGLATALLEMRARRRALTLATVPRESWNDSDTYWETITDLVRIESAYRVFRPINEGLACFLEFDAFPGDSLILSQPMALAMGMYHGDAKIGEESLRQLLRICRITPSYIRRKASLLAQPFSCRGSGYLQGYLAVKNLHFHAMSLSKRFYDSDLFAHYLKSFFYDCWPLVATLLDPKTPNIVASTKISEAFQRRIAAFAELDPGHLVEGFESRGKANEPDRFYYSDEFLSMEIASYPVEENTDSAEGKRLLQNLFSDLFHNYPNDESGRLMFYFDRDIVGLRKALILGEGSVRADVSSGGMIRYFDDGGNLMMARRTPDALKPGWSGTIRVVMFFTIDPSLGLYTSLIIDDEVIECKSIHGIDAPEQFQTPLVQREVRRKLLTQTQEFAASLYKRPEVSVTIEGLEEHLDSVYQQRSLVFADLDRIPGILSQMQEDGFLTMLGGELGLLKDAALASMCAGVKMPTSACSDYQWSQGDRPRSLWKINDCLRLLYGPVDAIITGGENAIFSRL